MMRALAFGVVVALAASRAVLSASQQEPPAGDDPRWQQTPLRAPLLPPVVKRQTAPADPDGRKVPPPRPKPEWWREGHTELRTSLVAHTAQFLVWREDVVRVSPMSRVRERVRERRYYLQRFGESGRKLVYTGGGRELHDVVAILPDGTVFLATDPWRRSTGYKPILFRAAPGKKAEHRTLEIGGQVFGVVRGWSDGLLAAAGESSSLYWFPIIDGQVADAKMLRLTDDKPVHRRMAAGIFRSGNTLAWADYRGLHLLDVTTRKRRLVALDKIPYLLQDERVLRAFDGHTAVIDNDAVVDVATGRFFRPYWLGQRVFAVHDGVVYAQYQANMLGKKDRAPQVVALHLASQQVETLWRFPSAGDYRPWALAVPRGLRAWNGKTWKTFA